MEPVDLSVGRKFHIAEGGFTTIHDDWRRTDDQIDVAASASVRDEHAAALR